MVNPNVYVAGIREATSLLVEGGKISLIGRDNKMKVFKEKLENTKEYSLTDDINFLLK
jgi:dipeptidase E